VRIAIGQINPVIGDFTGNVEKILGYAARARELGAELAVFPEMSVCGYPPLDLVEQPSFVEANLQALRRLQRSCPAGIGVAVGYVDRNRGQAGKALVNAVSLLAEGEILATQTKTLLPSYDVFDEARWFQPAASREVVAFRGERLGFAICEDMWWELEPPAGIRYPLDPVKELLDAGATLLLAPSASPFYSGKPGIRLALASGIGKRSGVPVVYVNTVGANDSLIFDGQSFLTSGDGRLVFLGEAFREQLAVVDTAAAGPELRLPDDRYGELARALELGIADYLYKCGFQRVHLGLSGGIDSALVATLAVRALGPQRVAVFALPSRYSTAGSLRDAEELAAKLGIPLQQVSIEPAFQASLESLQPVFRGAAPDITEENLQARIRGLLLMAYGNKFHSLLLATGNKSELATGYCTLYGDMCGGLAPIGDLLKTEVYALARRLNRDGPLIPESTLRKAPSAELKPDQTDQDTLPPYDELDRILERYLLDNATAGEIAAAGEDPATVRRILELVSRAEFKRRQAAPVLKVTPRAFGTGRRIPIARRYHET
jgi:NAD+ synthase (glutamine-hydrolysing)